MAEAEETQELSVTGKPIGKYNPPVRKKQDSAMRAEVFEEIGATLYGSGWRADLARAFGCSKSLITRVTNGERTLTIDLANDMSELVRNKIQVLGLFLDEDDFPNSDSAEVKEASKKIKEAIELLRQARQH